MLKRYGIYAPVLGEREDYPVILLRNAVTSENTNVQLWNGEIRKTKLRAKELVRSIDTVSSVNTSTDTILITGNVVSRYPSGATITIYDSANNYEQFTLSTTSTYVSTSTVLTVTGDITASTPTGFVFNDEDVGSVDPASDDFLKVAFPDSNPAKRSERFMQSSGVEMLVGLTKAHIYYWDTILTKWQLLFTCSSDTEYWDASQYGDNLVATNNIDRPVYWDGNTSNMFVNVDTQYSNSTSDYISKAAYVRSYRNYLFFGNVELSSGSRFQHDSYWSNIGEGVLAGGFNQAASKDAGSAHISGSGEITGGFGDWQGYLVVFKRFSHRKLWFTGGAIPFEQDELSPDVGCTAPGSVGNDKDGNLFYYGSDKAFREISAGKISHGKDNTARNINPSLHADIRYTYIDEYDELRWAIPSGNSAAANNKIIVYKEGRWDTDIDIAVTAFGKYSRQSVFTWDTLPYDTWDSWAWDNWDDVNASEDFPVDLCSDLNGYTYAMHGAYTDDGSEYDSSFVLTTDLADKTALMDYKRILQMYIYVRKEASGTLALSVKRDSETSFQALGSVELTGDEEILRQRLAVDVRARHFLIKVLGLTIYNFVGIEFEYESVGTR